MILWLFLCHIAQGAIVYYRSNNRLELNPVKREVYELMPRPQFSDCISEECRDKIRQINKDLSGLQSAKAFTPRAEYLPPLPNRKFKRNLELKIYSFIQCVSFSNLARYYLEKTELVINRNNIHCQIAINATHIFRIYTIVEGSRPFCNVFLPAFVPSIRENYIEKIPDSYAYATCTQERITKIRLTTTTAIVTDHTIIYSPESLELISNPVLFQKLINNTYVDNQTYGYILFTAPYIGLESAICRIVVTPYLCTFECGNSSTTIKANKYYCLPWKRFCYLKCGTTQFYVPVIGDRLNLEIEAPDFKERALNAGMVVNWNILQKLTEVLSTTSWTTLATTILASLIIAIILASCFICALRR